MSKLKIYIYGTGAYALYFYEEIKDTVDVNGFIECQALLGKDEFQGLPVLSSEAAFEEKFDFIPVCSQSSSIIIHNLLTVRNCQIQREQLIDPNVDIELFSFLLLIQEQYCEIAQEQQLSIWMQMKRLYERVIQPKLAQRVELQIDRIIMRLPTEHSVAQNYEKILVAESENERVDAIIAKRDLEVIRLRHADAQFHAMGDTEKGTGAIFFISLPLAASFFISQSLVKRLSRQHMGCHSAQFPGGTIILEQLYAFVKQGAITSGHIDPSPLNVNALRFAGIKKLVVHIRDPRSALVSATHHIGINSDPANVWRYHPFIDLPVEFFSWNFSKMIDHMISAYLPICIDWIQNWIERADNHDFDILITTFEHFKKRPSEYFLSILQHYNIDPKCFSDEWLPENKGDCYLRKGALEEWRDRCTPEQIGAMMRAIPEPWFERFGWPRE